VEGAEHGLLADAVEGRRAPRPLGALVAGGHQL
jgi:hypothetical protein